MTAEVHALPGADLPAAQLLRIVAEDNPRNVVVISQGADGEWRPSWTKMTVGELSFATHVLQAHLLAEIQ